MIDGAHPMEEYTKPTYFIDSDNPLITARAGELTADAGNDIEKAVKLFYFTRDEIRYSPYCFTCDVEKLVASRTLKACEGFCVQKSILLAALARAAGIPARLGFADIRNHLVPERLRKQMGTDLFAYHGYVEMCLDGRWVKATAVFDKKMCAENGIRTVEFNGVDNATFHKYNEKGELHIEYVRYHGTHADMPIDDMRKVVAEVYGW